jgi:hypothetical protein
MPPVACGADGSGAAAPGPPPLSPQQQRQRAGPAAPRRAAPRAKVLLLIIDGVGDVTIPAFGDRTPLQVAHTPNLDAIAGA